MIMLFICSHISSPAQPQSPAQSQRQFQHIKASKSMDLGTSQNQQHTGGVIFLFICSAWLLHASYPLSILNVPADACLLHWWHVFKATCRPTPLQGCTAHCRCSYSYTHRHSCTCRWGTIYACCMILHLWVGWCIYVISHQVMTSYAYYRNCMYLCLLLWCCLSKC